MSIAHHRKKQPEAVRKQLLDVAVRLSVSAGPASVTLEAVSTAAGVSKGGLLHHFPSKLALIDAMFDDLVGRLDDAIGDAMRRDPVAHGRYTRAYLDVVFSLEDSEEGPGWHVLTMALLAEPHLRRRWQQWVAERQDEFVGTDSSVDTQLVRFAADGLWFADLVGSHAFDTAARTALLQRLKSLTFL
ncbi:TetR/AcrR family transcriptional regulator [Pararhizobium sp.]|uniref:TetR/AcrR family transcriptional regulator n=1 Tax=Pararhizobium sp. TaxID=1977563 RepID=UPI0027182A62|nr:TetR/AcrR family transcriptional regulator [Pararhizobium sp.]MDO9414959.1 TetR/AcrR family transcriptional regulator [Pararhizobium sp.]